MDRVKLNRLTKRKLHVPSNDVVNDVMKSLKTIGLINPLIVDHKFQVVDGMARLLAAERLQWTHVYVIGMKKPTGK